MTHVGAQKNTLCAKCGVKSGGIFMCHGCQQSFCWKHTGEHRQELSNQMDTLGQEHDLLQRDMSQQPANHELYVQIDQWEKESIAKIQVRAEAARADLRKKLQYSKEQLQASFREITTELFSSRESNNFSEIDLTSWMERLKMIRQQLETPPKIRTVYDEKMPPIQMITIAQDTAIEQDRSKTTERSQKRGPSSGFNQQTSQQQPQSLRSQSPTIFSPYAQSQQQHSPRSQSPTVFSPYAQSQQQHSPRSQSPTVFSPYAQSQQQHSPRSSSPTVFSPYAQSQQQQQQQQYTRPRAVNEARRCNQDKTN